MPDTAAFSPNIMMIKLAIFAIVILLLLGLYKTHSYRIVNKDKSDNYYFSFFKTEVHYIPMGNWFELGNDKLEPVDIKTVQIVGRYFLKDRLNVYFKSVKIKNADPGTFEMLCSKDLFFARDKNQVYYGNYSFRDLDITSFKFTGPECSPFLMDKRHVYSIYAIENNQPQNTEIPPLQNVSVEKFRALNDFYATDGKTVYFKDNPIAGSDVVSFVLIGEYAKDSRHVYYNGLPVENLDPASFTPVDGGGYTKDKNGVYLGLTPVEDPDGHTKQFLGRPVPGADPETFVMIKGEKIDYAKDKSGYYWGGQPQSAQ